MPLRRNLDPTDIGPALLPYILLADVDLDARDVRHRVVGTNFAEHFGRDVTGWALSTVLDGTYRDFILGLFMFSAERQAPVYSKSRFRWDEGRMLRASRLMMPLSRDGACADMSLVAQIFDHEPPPAIPSVSLFEEGNWHDVSEQFSQFAVDAALS